MTRGSNSTAPHQHLDISRMRAIEPRDRRCAANDGITALIALTGVSTAAPVQPGAQDVTPGGTHSYLRLGNAPIRCWWRPSPRNPVRRRAGADA
jgi:apolipoprotein N-acyltransferase